MSNLNASKPRILFFGTPGQFSRGILAELVRQDFPVAGIVHRTAPNSASAVTELPPRIGGSLPVFGARAVDLDAIPRILVRDLNEPEIQERISTYLPDVIVAGCFPLLIPRSVRELASGPAVNVHPSLLPRHRGPDPIFWTFHACESETGVTIHALDDQFDTGPILAQAPLAVPPNVRYEDIEAKLAKLGGSVLTALLQSGDLPDPQPQQGARASREPFPQTSDLIIDQHWTVDRATRFINGCGYSHGPLTYRSGTDAWPRFHTLADPSNGAQIDLKDGFLHVRPIN